MVPPVSLNVVVIGPSKRVCKRSRLRFMLFLAGRLARVELGRSVLCPGAHAVDVWLAVDGPGWSAVPAPGGWRVVASSAIGALSGSE